MSGVRNPGGELGHGCVHCESVEVYDCGVGLIGPISVSAVGFLLGWGLGPVRYLKSDRVLEGSEGKRRGG